MAIEKSIYIECKSCGNKGVYVYSDNGQCVTCRRLDDIEKALEKTIASIKELTQVIANR